MTQKVCCVPECKMSEGDAVVLHRFPNPKVHADKFQSWISNIGGELLTMNHDTIFINRRICRKHFEKVYLYPRNRLCKLAIPVLHIPGVYERVIVKEDIIQPSTTSAQQIHSKLLISECQKSNEGTQGLPTQTLALSSNTMKTPECQKSYGKTQGLPTQTQVLSSNTKKTPGEHVSCEQDKQFKLLIKQIKMSEKYKASSKKNKVMSVNLCFLSR